MALGVQKGGSGGRLSIGWLDRSRESGHQMVETPQPVKQRMWGT